MTLRPFSSTLQGNFRDVFQTPGAPEVIDDSLPAQGIVNIRENYSSTGGLWVEPQPRGGQTAASAVAANNTQTLVTSSGDGIYIAAISLTSNFVGGTGGTGTLKIGTASYLVIPQAAAGSNSATMVFAAGNEPFVPSTSTVTVVSNNVNLEAYGMVQYWLA